MKVVNQRIIALIPSATLRGELEKRGILFDRDDLVSLAWHYSRSWEERMALLNELASPLAEKLLRVREEYFSPVPGEVYDLIDPDREHMLYASHELALRAAEQYPVCTIIKRKVLTDSGQSDDYLGSCRVVGGKEWMFRGENSPDAPEHCIFAPFLPDCAPVCWPDDTGRTRYGVSIHLADWDGQQCYLFDLDDRVMRSHDWDNLTYAHEHVPFPLVEAVELTGRRREDWQAFADYWKEK